MRRPKARNLWLILFILSPLAVLTLLCVLIAVNLDERADRAGQPQAPTPRSTAPGPQDAP